MISESKIEVRYAETDRMGIVYHANYLVWFENRSCGIPRQARFSLCRYGEGGYMSAVVDVQLRYGTPLTYGDTAIVRTSVSKLTQAKTEYTYEVYKEGQEIGVDKPCCTGFTSHCLVDSATFRPVSQKRAMPELYAAYTAALEAGE